MCYIKSCSNIAYIVVWQTVFGHCQILIMYQSSYCGWSFPRVLLLCQLNKLLLFLFFCVLHSSGAIIFLRCSLFVFNLLQLVFHSRTVHLSFLFYWCYNPLWVCILQPSSGAIASSSTRFLDHTQRRATVGRTPLDEWSVRRRDLYLTTHNTHNRQTSMTPVGFEPTIAAGERP